MVKEVTGGGNHYLACLEKKHHFNLKRPEETAGSNKHLQVPSGAKQGGADPPFHLQTFTFKELQTAPGYLHIFLAAW